MQILIEPVWAILYISVYPLLEADVVKVKNGTEVYGFQNSFLDCGKMFPFTFGYLFAGLHFVDIHLSFVTFAQSMSVEL